MAIESHVQRQRVGYTFPRVWAVGFGYVNLPWHTPTLVGGANRKHYLRMGFSGVSPQINCFHSYVTGVQCVNGGKVNHSHTTLMREKTRRGRHLSERSLCRQAREVPVGGTDGWSALGSSLEGCPVHGHPGGQLRPPVPHGWGCAAAPDSLLLFPCSREAGAQPINKTR